MCPPRWRNGHTDVEIKKHVGVGVWTQLQGLCLRTPDAHWLAAVRKSHARSPFLPRGSQGPNREKDSAKILRSENEVRRILLLFC